MVMWTRNTPAAPGLPEPRAPPPPARLPEYGEPGMLFPRRHARGRLLRQDCVNRIMACFNSPFNRADGLPRYGGCAAP